MAENHVPTERNFRRLGTEEAFGVLNSACGKTLCRLNLICNLNVGYQSRENLFSLALPSLYLSEALEGCLFFQIICDPMVTNAHLFIVEWIGTSFHLSKYGDN